MTTQTVEVNEGLQDVLQVIAGPGTYAVVNWFTTAGSAQLGSDFSVTPLSGQNVVVTSAAPLTIKFDIIDDTFVEEREFFNFHIDVTAYEAGTGRFLSDQSYIADRTIVIVDNEKVCFVDLDRDKKQDAVELTLEQARAHMRDFENDLKNVGQQLLLAQQTLKTQQDIRAGLEQAKNLINFDLALTYASFGLSKVGKGVTQSLVELFEAVALSTKVYFAEDSKEAAKALAIGMLGALKTLVSAAPYVGLMAETVDAGVKLNENAKDVATVANGINVSAENLKFYNDKFDTIKSDLAKLSTCFQGIQVQSFEPQALQGSKLLSFSHDINDTVVFHDLSLRLHNGTSADDTIVVPRGDGWEGLLAYRIENAGQGNDNIYVSPVVNGGNFVVIAGGEGRDTLYVDRPSTDFEWIVTRDGSTVLNTLARTAMGAWADGQDYFLQDVERIVFTDRHLVVDPVSVAESDPLFDPHFYLAKNPDVFFAGVNGKNHFDQNGHREGRDPSAFFSTSGYLSANKDVKAAGLNPLEHFRLYGWKEGRDPSSEFDSDVYLARNADVKAAGLNPLAHFLQYGQEEGREGYRAVGDEIKNGFDPEFYLLANPDVGAAGLDAAFHFGAYGWKEGRDPNAYFDTDWYLSRNPDVATAGVNPLDHYMSHGWRPGEHRDPSAWFDTSSYLAAYADVAAAGVNPLGHFLQHGVYEGRDWFDVVSVPVVILPQ